MITTLLMLLACTQSRFYQAPEDTGSPRDSGSHPDTGAPDDGDGPPADCPVDDTLFSQVSFEVGAIETVIDVHWEPTSDATTYAAFRDSNGQAQLAPWHEGGTTLRGLRPWSSVDLKLAAQTEQGWVCGTPMTAQTGGLPGGLPELSAQVPLPDQRAGGFTVVALLTQGSRFAVILDASGQYVWAREIPYSAAMNPVYRVTPTPDGRGLAYSEGTVGANEDGDLVRLDWDGVEESRLMVPGLGIDFTVLPDGTYAALAREWGDFTAPDGTAQRWWGDRIVEVDPTTGAAHAVWSVFDDFAPDDPAFAREIDEIPDWAHVNSISYDPDGDAYMITVDQFQTVARIDRSTGEPEWLLTDPSEPRLDGDFEGDASVQPHDLVNRAHSAQALGDGVLVFNRDDPTSSAPCSTVSEIGLDTTEWRAELRWTWDSEQCLVVSMLGEAQRLDGGNTMVIWSTLGQIDEVTPEGDLVLRVNTALGAAFAFGNRVPSLYADR